MKIKSESGVGMGPAARESQLAWQGIAREQITRCHVIG